MKQIKEYQIHENKVTKKPIGRKNKEINILKFCVYKKKFKYFEKKKFIKSKESHNLKARQALGKILLNFQIKHQQF
jgi:hypothetical protein